MKKKNFRAYFSEKKKLGGGVDLKRKDRKTIEGTLRITYQFVV